MKGSATILVVDDEPANRDILARRLSRDGYQVLEAENGPAALEQVAADDAACIQLVLLDVMMPGMDGLAVLQELRKAHSDTDLPVIMVTAKHDAADVVEALSMGANDYVSKPVEYPVLKARVDVQMARRSADAESRRLTALLEDRLASRDAELKRIAAAVECAGDAIAIYESSGALIYANRAYTTHTGWDFESARGRLAWDLNCSEHYREVARTVSRGQTWSGRLRTAMRDGRMVEEEGSVSPVVDHTDTITHYVSVMRDVTEQCVMAQQLAQAQKLESIGQLAAGIAHEINTPTQYVGDNTRFVKDAFGDVTVLLDTLVDLQATANGLIPTGALGEALELADVEYLRKEVPQALDQSIEGIERVTKIVRAMKEFSHPGQDKTLTDLNAAIESTVTVATNEWKYVAELSMNLDTSLPFVNCIPGAFNQVILNIVVNAAHAIADRLGTSPENKGVIDVTTRMLDGAAEIRITDNGSGMPENVKARIFDPFCTTKEVGKGTGQGLSIAYDVVVNKHGGTIEVESVSGEGTCFVILLPIDDEV